MKNTDFKSLIIGILLITTVFFGIGATGVNDKQEWEITSASSLLMPGTEQYIMNIGLPYVNPATGFNEIKKPRELWHEAADGAEPFAVGDDTVYFRRRIK
jgi:hypothetical protein